MGLKVQFDVNSVIATLRANGKDATDAAYLALKESGKQLRDLAREYAPVDDGDLEKAIITQPVAESGEVFVGIDPRAVNENGKSVGEYGLIMHEQLEPYGSGRFNLGKKSIDKNIATGNVGGKFIERAYLKLVPEIIKNVAFSVKRIFRS